MRGHGRRCTPCGLADDGRFWRSRARGLRALGLEAEAGETLTNAQKSKAVLVTYRGVANINAETVLSRHRDLQILFKYLDPLNDDEQYNWQIPIENIRPTLNWSGRWGPSEDAMLLVGAYRYGFGNWEAMAKDARLGLDGKFFLEEGKKGEDAASKPIPNAIHLVRRGDYLLGILREHDEKIRAIESRLTTTRGGALKLSLSPPPPASSSASAVPVASTSYASAIRRRAESEAVASVDEGASKKRKRRPTPTFTDSSSSEEWYVPFPRFLRACVLTVVAFLARRWTRVRRRRSCGR